MERCRVYYKGEGGGFLQVRAVVSLVCPCYPWLILAPKVLQLCTNHFVWVVCRPVWVSEACQLFLVPSWSSNMPLYPSKCCELESVPWLLPLLLSCTWTHFWVLQRIGSVSGLLQYIFLGHEIGDSTLLSKLSKGSHKTCWVVISFFSLLAHLMALDVATMYCSLNTHKPT